MPKFFNRKRELYVQDQFERCLFQCDTKQGFSEINQIPMQKRLLCVCLCFGLGPAPEVSSKLLKVVSAKAFDGLGGNNNLGRSPKEILTR